MIRIPLVRPLLAAGALALLPLATLALPALAAAQNETAQDPAYADLYASMEESLDQGRIIDSALAALAREFANTPEFSAAEAASPGLIAEVVEGLRPVFVAQNDRVRALYRPATIAVLANTFTPAEATSVAAFYRSDLGRKLMGGMSQNYVPQDTLATVQDGTEVTREQVEADLGRAANAAVAGMSEADLEAMGRMALTNPALLKLGQVAGPVQGIRVQMENEPLTAEENAAVVAVIEDVFSRRLGK